MKKLLFAIFIAISVAGCGPAVKHTVSPDFAQLAPYRVVVLPLIWERPAVAEADQISNLFRRMSAEKLSALNYQAVPLEDVERAGAGQKDWFAGKQPHEITALFNADSVLYIRLLDWDTDSLTPYASLKIKASYEMHSAAGKLLWKAEYKSKEADLSIDKAPMHLTMYKAYEPRIQRFVDAIFTTMPEGQLQEKTRKQYFKWLP